MIVIHDLKLVFAHIPKTAGSSVTMALIPWMRKQGSDDRELLPLRDWHNLGGLHVRYNSVRKYVED